MKQFPMCILALCILSVAAHSAEKNLAAYKAVYERELAGIAAADAKKRKADSVYLKALDEVRATAIRKADLATVKAAIAEKKRFQDFSNLTDEIPDKCPAAIMGVQADYRKALASAQAARDTRILALSRKYVAALKQFMISLMEAGKMDEASKVDSETTRVEFVMADIESRMPKPQPSRTAAKPRIRKPSLGPKPGQELAVELGDSVKMEFVWIPSGSFMMGSPESEEGRKDDEGPVHKVTIGKGFWMGKYEVTQEQYERVTGKNPSKFKGGKNPVEQVSWHDASRFCEVLAKKFGKTLPLRLRGKFETVRLPTEAEWEYACRAGTTTRFYTGDSESDLSGAGWWQGNSGGKTHAVGRKKPNAWGLCDMHGNVWEWCEDWHKEDYYSSAPGTDPRGPATGSRRVMRGGSWGNSADFCRVGYRYGYGPGSSYFLVGFRACLPSGQ